MTVNTGNNTSIAFKTCTPFSTCKTEINDVFINETNHIYIAMPMYNLIKYSNNYSDISGSLLQFKRDEFTDSHVNLTTYNSKSFKYKAYLVEKTANADNNMNSSVKDAKIVVPLKYLGSFWRSLEIPLINCKIYLELNWIEDCILSSAGHSAKFNIKGANLNVPMVIPSTKNNVNLPKQLCKGFKRSVYWNSYQIISAKVIHDDSNIYELLSARLLRMIVNQV